MSNFIDSLKADDVHMKNDYSSDIFNRVKINKEDPMKSRKASFDLIKKINIIDGDNEMANDGAAFKYWTSKVTPAFWLRD